MWVHLADGWRDESSEGPYTETLQTKGDWQIVRIFKVHGFGLEDKKYDLIYKGSKAGSFDSIEGAKKYVKEH